MRSGSRQRVKVLIDMNLSPRWVGALQEVGIAAEHWSTVGATSATDPEPMAYARSHDFVVLTHDLDFGAILAATGGDKPSVAQIRAADVRPEVAGPPVSKALMQLSRELAAGALITIEPGRTRARLLPLPVE